MKPLKNKNGKIVFNAFIEIANESNRKPNKLCVNQGKEFYNKLMKEWLMYSKHNEGKPVIAESFIKTLKSIKKWQLMTENLIFLIWINY